MLRAGVHCGLPAGQTYTTTGAIEAQGSASQYVSQGGSGVSLLAGTLVTEGLTNWLVIPLREAVMVVVPGLRP